MPVSGDQAHVRGRKARGMWPEPARKLRRGSGQRPSADEHGVSVGLAFATAVGISPLSFGTDHGLWMGQGQLGTIASLPNGRGAPHPCWPRPSTLPDARLQAPQWELELLLNTFCVSSCGGGVCCAAPCHHTLSVSRRLSGPLGFRVSSPLPPALVKQSHPPICKCQ